jgi:hypothetical protein
MKQKGRGQGTKQADMGEGTAIPWLTQAEIDRAAGKGEQVQKVFPGQKALAGRTVPVQVG